MSAERGKRRPAIDTSAQSFAKRKGVGRVNPWELSPATFRIFRRSGACHWDEAHHEPLHAQHPAHPELPASPSHAPSPSPPHLGRASSIRFPRHPAIVRRCPLCVAAKGERVPPLWEPNRQGRSKRDPPNSPGPSPARHTHPPRPRLHSAPRGMCHQRARVVPRCPSDSDLVRRGRRLPACLSPRPASDGRTSRRLATLSTRFARP